MQLSGKRLLDGFLDILILKPVIFCIEDVIKAPNRQGFLMLNDSQQEKFFQPSLVEENDRGSVLQMRQFFKQMIRSFWAPPI